MYQVISGSTQNLPDVRAFIERLNMLATHPMPEVRSLFAPAQQLTVARAPGRLDLMGGIADYSGSLVLQLPIREATLAALQRDPDRELRIISLGAADNDRSAGFAMPLADLEADGQPISYEAAQAYFQREPAQHWAAYIAGTFLVLMRERGVTFDQGARILLESSVPEGKGVSSSAAVEVATMAAVAAAFGIELEPREMALLCQKVENLVVGAPCGVMDQMTSVCGQANRLLALLCQPAELQGTIALPDEVAVWGLDSGIRHAVSGADYGSVRIGAFMGYRIIAELAGLTVRSSRPGQPVEIIDPRWHGYLANLTPSEIGWFYWDDVPVKMAGDAFLAQYGGTHDSVTQVDPAVTYAVMMPTAHPIFEHHRVRTYAELLHEPINNRRLALLGEAMYQSHASYSGCGLGSEGTDRLVELVRAAGPTKGLYGAKITGGGSGGTVAILGRRDAEEAVQEIAAAYEQETGHHPHLFVGSSPGAAAFGTLRLGPIQP
jgi:L-arabinokinase